MKILILSATLFDKQSPFHKMKKNVLIHNGKIVEIGDKEYNSDRVIDGNGLLLSNGWFDLGSFIGDPGLEHKEDQNSLATVAKMGGFTELALLPNTIPAIQTKNGVKSILQNNPQRLVQFHPMACVTNDFLGEDLTDMIDLKEAGAVAFTDGLKSVWHTDIFLKTLQYLQTFNGVLVDHPDDTWLSMYGQMNEGFTSTSLGLKGIPNISEEITLGRNIELLNYTGGYLHCAHLSTTKSIELIRLAKKRGLPITCDVTSYQAILEDNLLEEFETVYKVNPPLREKSDCEAIIKGLKDGTIDVICSGHLPQNEECKNVEFDLAEFGMINLQTFGFTLTKLSKFVAWEDLFEKITTTPRQILKLPIPRIDINQKANLTLFAPTLEWTLDSQSNGSKSKNSPWFGKKIIGKTIAVFNNNKHWIYD